jgi:hypothetical protein
MQNDLGLFLGFRRSAERGGEPVVRIWSIRGLCQVLQTNYRPNLPVDGYVDSARVLADHFKDPKGPRPLRTQLRRDDPSRFVTFAVLFREIDKNIVSSVISSG